MANYWQLVDSWVPLAVSAAAALLLVAIIFRIGWKIGKRVVRSRVVARTLMDYAEEPARLLGCLVVLQAIWHSAPDDLHAIGSVQQLTAVCLIGAATWLVVRLVSACSQIVLLHYPADVKDNLNARRIHTQTRVLSRTLMLFAIVFGLASALMTFPSVRQIGTGLLASAGLAGLVVGFAAKPLLGNVLAGLLIAFTQPIRLDDVVIVEGEWGRIEEINGSYVVLALWDERRLIVPLQWFIEHPFQNWTRTSAQILGTIFLWVDFGFPVDPLREELATLCEGNPEWDRRVCGIQVTDASDRAMQLRILVSSASASQNWDLRCFLRERLIAFIARDHPGYLPRVRMDNSNAMPRPDVPFAG
jgi:small-conductance mechanosensitive channel